MSTINSKNISDLWMQSIQLILQNGSPTEECSDDHSIGTFFGLQNRSTIEQLGITARLKDPRKRILISSQRKINYSYLFANFLFLLSPEKGIDFIDFYNTKGRLFCDDGKTLNAPLGYRIQNERNQIERVKFLLEKDSSSRRAIIQIAEKGDLFKDTRDFPCLNYFQVFIRDERLVLLSNMRSQSVASLLPYDVFLFSLFQEALSVYMNVKLGEYIHFCGSYHIYTDEIDKAKDIVNSSTPNSYLKMKRMQSFNPSVVKELFASEKYIRGQIKNNKDVNFDMLNVDDYWKGFLQAMTLSFICSDNINDNLKGIVETSDKKLLHPSN